MNNNVDAVIMWVDNRDENWLAQRETWYRKINPDKRWNSHMQYQNWDNFHYWFRAIEKFIPWLHHIYLITAGHLPPFIDLGNPRLKIVKHEEFIPAEYLPTFNPCCIEMNIHRIAELSDNIIIFNDDTIPLKPIAEDYYFQDNKVCDEAVETPIIPVNNAQMSQYVWNLRGMNMSVINRNFSKREVQELNWEKWFCDDYGELLERNISLRYWDSFLGFRDPHVPSALKKSTLATLWNLEENILHNSCRNRFRDYSCVNQWLIRYWQLCEGNFIPRRTLGKSYVVNMENCKEVAEVIRNQKLQMICINEECTMQEFEYIKKEINTALDDLLPEKSSFEK